MQLWQRFDTEPVGSCDDFENQPCVLRPIYSITPTTVSPTSARLSLKRVPGGNADFWGFFVEQNIIRRVHNRPRRYLFVPNENILTQGFAMAGLKQSRKTVILHDISRGRVLEDECHEERAKGQLDVVWSGNTSFHFSESVPMYRPSGRKKQQRSVQQQNNPERGLRLKGQALRIVGHTMAKTPSGDID